MAPGVISLYCGCGSLALGFRNAGYEIIGGCDEDIDAVWTFQRNFRNAKNLFCKDIYKEVVDGNLQRQFGDTKNTILIVTPPRSVPAEHVAFFPVSLKPVLMVLVIPTDLTNGEWLEVYRSCMVENGIDTLIFPMDTAEYGSPISIKRTMIINIPSNRIGLTGCKKEAEQIMFQIAQNLYLNKQPMISPRIILNSVSGIVVEKDYIFLTPRDTFDRATYSIDKPLPTLRQSCVRIKNPTSYEKREKDIASIEECLFLTHKSLSILCGLPKDFVNNISFTKTTKLLINSLCPLFARVIAKAIFDIQISIEHIEKRTNGIVVTPSTNLYFEQLPISEDCNKQNLFQKSTRMHQLLNVSPNSKVSYFYGRTKEKRHKVTYVVGSDIKGDNYIKTFTNFDIPVGWMVEIKERKNNIHAKEDLFWISPIGKTYRTIKTLKTQIDRERNKKEKKYDQQ